MLDQKLQQFIKNIFYICYNLFYFSDKPSNILKQNTPFVISYHLLYLLEENIKAMIIHILLLKQGNVIELLNLKLSSLQLFHNKKIIICCVKNSLGHFIFHHIVVLPVQSILKGPVSTTDCELLTPPEQKYQKQSY